MPLLEDPPFNFIVYDTISATPYTSQAQDYSSETANNFIPPKKFYYCNNAAAKSSNTSMMLEAAGGGGGKKTKQMSSHQQPQGQGEGQGRKKRRRKARVCKNKEEAETQRMTHIAVERNRRKQMNDHLAILRSLMPDSYAQRGDQASIVGGAIEFVKELEHLLQSLEAQKLQLFQHQQQHNPEDIVTTPSKIVPSSPFTQLLEYPQKHSWSHSHCPNNKYTSKTKGATADIEVTLIETHANLKILSRRNIAARSQLPSSKHLPHFLNNKMEHFYLTLLLGFVSFITLSLSVLFYRHRAQFVGTNLPPGKVGYPVIGETYQFLATGWKGHPEKFIFDRMTKYSSEVFKTSLMGEKAAIFCGAACNKFLFSNENKLVTAWWPSSVNKVFPSSMETSAKEEAKKMRKMLPNFMKPEALQRYIGIMDTVARRHFAEGWENKKEVEVFPLAKNYTFWLAARLFVSLDDSVEIAKLGDPFAVLAAGLLSMPLDFPGTPFYKAIKASNFIREELTKIIKQRKIDLAEGKASPTQDILSHMLLLCDEHGSHMKEHDIADKILGLLIGGHDTASATCTFIVKYLAELPHIYDEVYKEQMDVLSAKAPGELLNWDDLQKMKYSWNVAQEVLRLAPPLQGAFREALSDFVFNGFTIPKGWKLYWSANSTHKNAAYFPEPFKFDPSRFEGKGPAPYTFVPFGGGPRMCPGKEYARLEILVFMHNLVKRFKWEKVIPNEQMVVDPMPVPAKGLPVRLFPHPKTAAA